MLSDLPELIIGGGSTLPSEGLALLGILNGQAGEWREIGNEEIRCSDGRYQLV